MLGLQLGGCEPLQRQQLRQVYMVYKNLAMIICSIHSTFLATVKSHRVGLHCSPLAENISVNPSNFNTPSRFRLSDYSSFCAFFSSFVDH